MQEGDSVKDAIHQVPTAQRYIVIRGRLDQIKETTPGGEEENNCHFPELSLIMLCNLCRAEGAATATTAMAVQIFSLHSRSLWVWLIALM